MSAINDAKSKACEVAYFSHISFTYNLINTINSRPLASNEIKNEGKYQESIQSSTTPDPRHHMEK